MTRKFFRENLTTQNYIPVKETDSVYCFKVYIPKKKKKKLFSRKDKNDLIF